MLLNSLFDTVSERGHATSLFFWQRKSKLARTSARFCPGVSEGTVRGEHAIWRWTSTRYACPRRKRRESRKNSDLDVCGKISTSITMVSEGYFADSLFFNFSRSLLDICDSMTSDSFIFLDGSTSGGVIRQFSYFTLNILCQIFEVFYNNSTIYRHCF